MSKKESEADGIANGVRIVRVQSMKQSVNRKG